jgi:hypothetical protein
MACFDFDSVGYEMLRVEKLTNGSDNLLKKRKLF